MYYSFQHQFTLTEVNEWNHVDSLIEEEIEENNECNDMDDAAPCSSNEFHSKYKMGDAKQY